MKMKELLAMLAFSFGLMVQAAVDPLETTALSMVPRGELIRKTAREYLIKTKAKTKINLEFEQNGKFQEASGMNLASGDDLEPGMGLISLHSAAARVTTQGQKVKGEWFLEKDSTHGWVYQLAGESTDEEVFHLVHAVSGQFIGTLTTASPEVIADNN